MKKFASFFAGTFILGLGSLSAATFPYTNDFSGTGSNTAFTTESTGANGTWTVSGGVYTNTYSSTSITPSIASNVITGMAGNSFTIQTQFTLSSIGSVNSNGQSLGFGLFGLDASFTGGNTTNAYYLADWQVANSSTPGNLRIVALGDTTGYTNTAVSVDAEPSVANLAAAIGTTYTLKLTGTYVGSTLNMTLGVYDATGTTQIGSTATASDTSPLTGTNFGYRSRIGLGGGSFSANFDNYSVTAVPEPGSLLLLSLAGGLFAGNFRRRQRSVA